MISLSLHQAMRRLPVASLVAATSAAGLFLPQPAPAQGRQASPAVTPSGLKEPPPAGGKEKSLYDKIWGIPVLYKNDNNPWLEEVAVTGRYQGQLYNTDSDTGSIDDWENRRFHLGLQIQMLDKTLKFKVEMASNDEFDPFYSGLRDAYMEWLPSKALVIRAGKFETKFTREYSISAREILTLERSQLINQFRLDYLPAVSVSGAAGKWNWYAAATSDDLDKEFGGFSGGWSAVGSVGYDISEAIHAEKADVRLDYLHSEIDSKDTIYNFFDNGVSLSLQAEQGKWTLINDFIGGFSDERGNAFSWVLLPGYRITPKLQAIARYTFSASDEEDGLAPQSRYERAAGGGRGDRYNAALLGLNWYLYGHKLKLMTGTEYARMSGGSGAGYDGWTTYAAVRMYW